MNKQEARRYAHKVAANALGGALGVMQEEQAWPESRDGQMVLDALRSLTEQHARFGPKSTDKTPQLKERHATPLFDEPTATQQVLAP